LPDNCLLIALDVESMYNNIDHTKELQTVGEVIGNYPLYDPVTCLLGFLGRIPRLSLIWHSLYVGVVEKSPLPPPTGEQY